MWEGGIRVRTYIYISRIIGTLVILLTHPLHVLSIQVPGIFHYPALVKSNMNISTPATTADFLPTIMSILQVTTDNPTWAMDGLDLATIIAANQEAGEESAYNNSSEMKRMSVSVSVPRPRPMGFWTGGQQVGLRASARARARASARGLR